MNENANNILRSELVSKCYEEELVNSQEQLEGKKKRLMEENESAFTIATPMIPKPNCSLGFGIEIIDETAFTIATPMIPKPNCLGFGIEVIDETALLDCIPKNRKQQSRRKPSKNTVPEKKKKTRRKKKKKKKKYSRVMMESLRFVNVSQQHKFWKKIYAVLQSAFADEYDTLVVAAALNNRHALPFLRNKKPTTSDWSILFSSLQFILYYGYQILFSTCHPLCFYFYCLHNHIALLSATIRFLLILEEFCSLP